MKLADLVAFYLGKSTESCIEVGTAPGETHPQDLPLTVAEWPSEWQEAFEERAAIMELEGGLSRDEGDLAAQRSIRSVFLRQQTGGQLCGLRIQGA